MKNIVRNWIVALLFVTSIGGATFTLATPGTTYAACATQNFLTFPTWYKGLVDDSCNIVPPDGQAGSHDPMHPTLQTFIWTIVLNVIEFMLQLVGYLSVGFLIFGGYKYMISAGAADGMIKARKTIMNAIIGLVLSIFSVAIVNLISGVIH
jgi:hypothetical protein